MVGVFGPIRGVGCGSMREREKREEREEMREKISEPRGHHISI